MPAITLVLRFACWNCDEETTATVHCAGMGLQRPARVVVRTKLPCYHCGRIHEVAFRTTGEVVHVKLDQCERHFAVPSCN